VIRDLSVRELKTSTISSHNIALTIAADYISLRARLQILTLTLISVLRTSEIIDKLKELTQLSSVRN